MSSRNYIKETITIGRIPYAIAASPDYTNVYVMQYRNTNLVIIDTETNELYEDNIQIGATSVNVIFNKKGTNAYIANEYGYVTVIDVSTNSILEDKTINSEGYNSDIALSPDDNRLYVTIADSNVLRVFNVDDTSE